MKKTFPLNINFKNLFSPTGLKRQKDKEMNLLLRREEMEGKRRKKKGGGYTHITLFIVPQASSPRGDRIVR